MQNKLTSSVFFILLSYSLLGQGYSWGAKIGGSINKQKWNGFERELLPSPHIDFFTETYDGSLNRFYASVGYHTRGSAIGAGIFGNGTRLFKAYRFHNAVAQIGGKRMIPRSDVLSGYYVLGLRGEYTFATNLEKESSLGFLPLSNGYVKRFLYGVTIGGGFEYQWKDDKLIFLEVNFNPDLSKQYEQLVILQYTDSFGQKRTLPTQEVRNISLELSVGIRFLSFGQDQ